MNRLHILTISLFVLIPAHNLAQSSHPVSLVTPDRYKLTPTVTMDLAKIPEIYFAETKFDFGQVEEGPVITHEFKFYNRGHSTLKIQQVGDLFDVTDQRPIPKWYKSDVPPGGQTTFPVSYHTMGRPGHATKLINFTTNDPLHPIIQLEIDMTVVREVDVMPDKVYFYAVKHGEGHSAQVRVLGKPGLKLEILSVESTGKVVSVTSTPYSEGDRHGATLNVTLPATQPIGNINDDLIVMTTSLKKPQLDIQVVGEVVGRVQWIPKSVNLGANQDQPVSINISANPPQGFVVRRVSSVKHLCSPFVKTVTNPDGSVGY